MPAELKPAMYGKYKRPEKVFEEFDNTRITEQAGYIPAHIQVQQLINAGVRLNQYREDQYDFRDEKSIDMDLEDPTRQGNFDLADASELQQIAQANLQNLIDESTKQAKLDEDKAEIQTEPSEKAE